MAGRRKEGQDQRCFRFGERRNSARCAYGDFGMIVSIICFHSEGARRG